MLALVLALATPAPARAETLDAPYGHCDQQTLNTDRGTRTSGRS